MLHPKTLSLIAAICEQKPSHQHCFHEHELTKQTTDYQNEFADNLLSSETKLQFVSLTVQNEICSKSNNQQRCFMFNYSPHDPYSSLFSYLSPRPHMNTHL